MSDSYLLIIDGSSLLSTQYYGNLPRQILYAKTTEEKEKYYDKIMSTRSGVYTNGVYGFLRTLLKIINENKPSHLAVCWDLTRDTFRRKLYADYKATRSETPKPLSSQFALMQEVLRRIGAAQFMDETYEADDFAGTLSHRFSPEIDVKILTKDRDYLQLVNEKTHVWMVQSSEEKTEEAFRKYKIRKEDANVPDKTLELDEALTKAEYEIEPRFVTSLKALEGDPSDNIPGVPGIGHQTAVKLVNAYGDVEALYDELHRIKDIGEDTLKARWKNELGITRPPLGALLKTDPDSLVGEEAAMLSKQLATISFDAPIGAIGLSDLKLDLNTEELTKVLLELEMNSLLSFLGDSGKKEDFFPGYREISDDTEAVEFFRSRKKAAVLGVSYLAGAGLAVSDGSETVFLREFFLLTREFFAEALKKAAEEGTVVSSFSGKELVKAFGIVTYDLSIASYLLEPLSNQYSPERIAQENLNVTLSAEEGEEQSALYAFAAAKLAPILLKKLEEQSMRDLYETIELPTMKALAELEETGIRVDEKALSDFSAVLKAKIDVLSEEIYALAGEQFNINSPKQLGDVLYGEKGLNLPHGKKGKNGLYSI